MQKRILINITQINIVSIKEILFIFIPIEIVKISPIIKIILLFVITIELNIILFLYNKKICKESCVLLK